MTTNPLSPLDLNPKPSMIKINSLAFLVICLGIFIIVCVLAYSIGEAGKHNKIDSQSISQNQINDSDDKALWFNDVSDALPSNPNRANLPNQLVSDDISMDANNSKKQAESLHAAFDSSIKAPNIENITPSNNLNSRDSPGSSLIEYGENSSSNLSDPNMQNEKKSFLLGLHQKINPDYLHASVTKPISPYEIKAGTIIPAVMMEGINSDLPGQPTAIVSKNVYDSVSGHYLLIPQGAKLNLQYDSKVSYGQRRLLVAVSRLIFPNGNSLDLNGMPASDSSGYAGLYDEIDNHYVRIFGSSAMMGLISGGFEIGKSSQASEENNPSTSQVLSSALGQQIGQVSLGMMNKNLDIQPTLKIQPGYEFNIKVTSDLVFPGPYRY